MTYPAETKKIAALLQQHGYRGYAVGGCVRDALMGRVPNDWDMTTDCPPEEMLRIFGEEGLRTIPTGLKHGTVTVLLNGQPFECTTFRIDGSYTDARRPDKVTFTGELAADLCRRDFTVNAMAGDPLAEGDPVVDLYGGREDLKNKVIRAVGDPETRFTEDALRILRAVRFATVLNFEIEKETLQAAKLLAPRLAMVSAERKRVELEKLLCSPYADRGAELLFEVGAASYIHPEMRPPRMRLAALSSRFAPRLAALFSPDGPPDLGVMKLSGEVSRATRSLCDRQLLEAACDRFSDPGARARSLIRTYGDLAADAALLQGKEELGPIIAEEALRKPCVSLSALAVGGSELTLLGVQPKKMGEVLSFLLDAVIEDPTKNTKECLLGLIKIDDGSV